MSKFAGQRIAMLGIEGSGMRGLATLLNAEGAEIVGVDQRPETPDVMSEENASPRVTEANLVIYSDALPTEHPLRALAAEHHIPTLGYHEAVGELSRSKRTLAVTGTHGKSSTSSMVAHIFTVAGLDPTALIGAGVPAWGGQHARVGAGEWFIVEADEYRNHFLSLRVESAIITSIDFDHPDFFASEAAVVESFKTFIHGVSGGTIIVPESVVKTRPDIVWPAATRSVTPPERPIELVLPGRHMQMNAWLAIQMAAHYGISEAIARAALASYAGLGRRFELLGYRGKMAVISDYGHHPAEIAATLQAARERYPHERLCALFEPHTGERLVEFAEAFVDALSAADAIVLAPPYLPTGRSENQIAVTHAFDQIRHELEGRGTEVRVLNELAKVSDILSQLSPLYDVAIAFSAGRLDQALRNSVNEK